MQSFIKLEDIQNCLKQAGVKWDGRKGRTQFNEGVVATIDDFSSGDLVPVRVEFEGLLYEHDMLLEISDTVFLIYQELYHPHDDDYMVLYEDLSEQWKNLLLKTHKKEYSEVWVDEIEQEIKLTEETFEEEFLALKEKMKELQDRASQAIDGLRAQQKRIKAFAQAEDLVK